MYEEVPTEAEIRPRDLKSNPRLQAAHRFANLIKRQGFIPRSHFTERIAERALGGGARFDARTFRREFFAAAHYRQTRPGYTSKIAVVRGVPILYRVGGRQGKQIVLMGALPLGSLPPARRIRPPVTRELAEPESAAWEGEVRRKMPGMRIRKNLRSTGRRRVKGTTRGRPSIRGVRRPGTRRGTTPGPTRYRRSIRWPRRRYWPLRRRGIIMARTEAPCPRPASEFVRWIQYTLNDLLGSRLRVTGIMNGATRAAIRAFQRQEGMPTHGIAGPDIEQALLAVSSGLLPAGEPIEIE